MRIAIISDIHSNYQALLKALAVIDERGVNHVYCLGDIVGYGGNPNECVELVRSRASHVVVGNHDQGAIDTSLAVNFTKPGRIAAEWTHKALTKGNLEYLSTLPYRVDTELCTLVHASLENPDDWRYVMSPEIARVQFPLFATQICFIGHTHVPVICGENLRTFTFKKDLRFIINVGSVGQPRDSNPKLSFGLLDTDVWTYENIRATYDVKSAAQAINDAGLPGVLASRLIEGL